MNQLLSASATLWALALGVGAIDGLYFHLWRFRLHVRSRSRTEHIAHTGRALLLPPTLLLAFFNVISTASGSERVSLLVAFIGVDWSFGIWDAFIETKSRQDLGGLPRSEYLVHLVATGLHSGAEVLAVAAWALSVRCWSGSNLVDSYARAIGIALLPASVAVALLHILFLHPRFRHGNDLSHATETTPPSLSL